MRLFLVQICCHLWRRHCFSPPEGGSPFNIWNSWGAGKNASSLSSQRSPLLCALWACNVRLIISPSPLTRVCVGFPSVTGTCVWRCSKTEIVPWVILGLAFTTPIVTISDFVPWQLFLCVLVSWEGQKIALESPYASPQCSIPHLLNKCICWWLKTSGEDKKLNGSRSLASITVEDTEHELAPCPLLSNTSFEGWIYCYLFVLDVCLCIPSVHCQCRIQMLEDR